MKKKLYVVFLNDEYKCTYESATEAALSTGFSKEGYHTQSLLKNMEDEYKYGNDTERWTIQTVTVYWPK